MLPLRKSVHVSNSTGRMNGFGPRCLERFRAIFSPSSSRGTISKHLRLMQACFLMPTQLGPIIRGLGVRLWLRM